MLTLKFSETVQRATLSYQKITLVNQDRSVSMDLKGELPADEFNDIFAEDGAVLKFRIDTSDSNTIKKDTNIGTSESDTFFIVNQGLVSDMAGNGILGSQTLINAGVFEPDTLPPVVNSFKINLDEGTLAIIFDEVVQAKTFDPRELTITSNVNCSSACPKYQLSGAEEHDGNSNNFAQDDGTEVNLTFLKRDLDEIKRLQLCGKDQQDPEGPGGTCHISLTQWLVVDMRSNGIVACH